MTRFRILVFCTALLAEGVPVFGQLKQPTRISGKDHPELIDDATAYWHLFRILSRAEGEADEMFQRRRLAIANKTYLAKEQITLLLRAADTFTQQMAAFAGQRETPALREARTKAVLGIVSALHSSLGEQGSFILTSYVNGQHKQNIFLLDYGR